MSYFKIRKYNIIEYYIDFWSELRFQHSMAMGEKIISHFTSGKADEVQVIYNEFISVGKQVVKLEKFLPLTYDQDDSLSILTDRIYGPSKESVVKEIVPKFLNTQIWQYLLESFASEQAARMLAMENATTNAQDMIKDLSLKFNKARQSAITTEMLEIVSGAEALN